MQCIILNDLIRLLPQDPHIRRAETYGMWWGSWRKHDVIFIVTPGLPSDNNFQPITRFVSIALLGNEILVGETLHGYGGKHMTWTDECTVSIKDLVSNAANAQYACRSARVLSGLLAASKSPLLMILIPRKKVLKSQTKFFLKLNKIFEKVLKKFLKSFKKFFKKF